MKTVLQLLKAVSLICLPLQCLFGQQVSENTPDPIQIYFDSANVLLKQGRYPEALVQAKLGQKLQFATLPPGHIDFAHSYYLIGAILNSQSLHQNAIPYLDSALLTIRANTLNDSLLYVDILLEKGTALTYAGQFEEAGPILTQVLTLQKKSPGMPAADLVNTYIMLGTLHERLKRFDEAIDWYNQALNVLAKTSGLESVSGANCYSQIIQLCIQQKEYAKALDYGMKEQAIMVQIKRDTHPDFGYLCNDLGNIYFALKKYPEAVLWQKKALAIFKKSQDERSEDISAMYLHVAQALAGNGEYREAIDSCREDIRLTQQYLGARYFYLYGPESLIGYCYWKLYRKSGDKNYLASSRSYFDQSFQRIEAELQTRNLAAMRRAILSSAVNVAGNYLQTEAEFFHTYKDQNALANCWKISEFMHGYLLNAASQEANARHFAGIPDVLLQQDSLLRNNIMTLEERRNDLIESGSNNPNDSVILDLDSRIYQRRHDFVQLQKSFEKNYPAYFNLKYQLNPEPLEAVQRMLQPQQTLLEYFASDTSLFVIAVHPDHARILELPLDSSMALWVKQFREGIAGCPSRQKSSAYAKMLGQYVTAAQKLYDQLLRPLEAELTPELIIVPTEELAYLPFEALLAAPPTELGNFNTYRFLLRKYTIQYAYSASNLVQLMSDNATGKPAGNVLAMAPFYTSDVVSNGGSNPRSGFDLTMLPYSGEEVRRVLSSFQNHSTDFYGNQATKSRFWSMAPNYRILHLATHGKANNKSGDFSFLAFSSDTLNLEAGFVTAGELYNYRLNADLVTLSACETGIGELQRGEGTASLARAFSFAGARTVVSSLWSVNDNSTMLIMDGFYQELKAGKAKNLALANAKRKFLENNPGQLQHPFYWAAFIGAGDYRPLNRN